jgi:oxygen-independent coproporphyrinogen-3 oxidase
MCNDELEKLGRIHDAKQAQLAINSARIAGFENVSADLMLGISGQTVQSINKTIEDMSDGMFEHITHISAYMLKIEENTPYCSDSKILSSLPDEDSVAEIYLHTIKKLSEYGYHQYEISNFAKQGYECRHNLKYWKCKDYYGIGPSAHSCINGQRFAVKRDIKEFISSPVQKTIITEENSCDFFEQAMLRLRLSEGLDLSLFPEYAKRIVLNAQPLINSGLVKQNGSSIIITPNGYLVSNEIICRLLDVR